MRKHAQQRGVVKPAMVVYEDARKVAMAVLKVGHFVGKYSPWI